VLIAIPADRLPRPLFFRAVLIGSIMGGATSGLQIAQDHVRKLKEKDELESGESGLAQPVSLPIVGRPVQSGEKAMPAVHEASRALSTAAESDRLRRRSWWDPRRWVGM
jgi:hypothetical protein